MWEYFSAGLLAGLLLWILTEVCCQLIRRRPLDRAGAAAFAVLPAAGRMEDLEYLLRRTKAQLAEGDLPAGRILVLDRGMDPAARQVVLRFPGARLCTESELGPLLAGMRPGRREGA